MSISALGGAGAVLALAAASTDALADKIPLHFAPGAYVVTVRGRMTPDGRGHDYSLDVRKGQTLTLTFEGEGPLQGSIDCRGGSDGPFSGYDDQFVVPESGECIVHIGISRMAELWTGGFTLSVKAK